ncbi:MAG: sacsin N-terminal ATP-binding-like domain-containing protein [Sporichthyaceae bacterium]
MATDYEAVRRDSLARFGTDRNLFVLVSDQLYGDRAHFIYELIQNAEDARASTVSFDLQGDRLVLRHDGRPFSSADVRSICRVAASTKAGDESTIGRFGVGFKSVYSYTARPRIHSGEEHFEIADFVSPAAVRPLAGLSADTVIILPFDREGVPASVAQAEIRTGLANLRGDDLLFARSVHTIEVLHNGVVQDVLSRDLPFSPDVVEVTHRRGGRVFKHPSWLRFSRPVPGHPNLNVEIAFRRTDHGPDAYGTTCSAVDPVLDATLAAFFSTGRPSGLTFIVQAPFRTTPARDNVPNDPWNRELIAVAAELLVAILRELRDAGRLSARLLELLPLRPDQFAEGSLLRPLHDAVARAMATEPLLPTDEGYVLAAEARSARTAGLRDLLDPELLRLFHDSDGQLRWLSHDISMTRTPVLWSFLREVLRVPDLDMEWLASRLTADCLDGVPTEWLCKLYALLADTPALWRPFTGGAKAGPLRRMPFLRCEDGSMRAPFDSDDTDVVFLPSAGRTTFPTVMEAITEDAAAIAFLRALGLREPDRAVEVEQFVLPRYVSSDVAITDAQYADDVAVMVDALESCTGAARGALVGKIDRHFVICASDTAGQGRYFCRPQDTYVANDELLHYAAASGHMRFIGASAQLWGSAAEWLGLRWQPKQTAVPCEADGHVSLTAEPGRHRRGLRGFHPGFEVEGLSAAVGAPDLRRSAYVWNSVLVPNARRLVGIVECSTSKNWKTVIADQARSPAGLAVITSPWLPGPDESWVIPAEIDLDTLPAEFSRSTELAEALGMIRSAVVDAGRQLGIPPALAHRLATDPALVERLQREIAAETQAPTRRCEADPSSEPEEPIDFATLLAQTFERASKPGLPVEAGQLGTVALPGQRRERVAEEIRDVAEAAATAGPRFSLVPRKVWDAKDSTVRTTLREWYRGRCQICDDTFYTRDGRPYFEGLHLVSTTHAAWVDRVGNVLALCATCCAKFVHGDVNAATLVEQVLAWRPVCQGGEGARMRLALCGEEVVIRFDERHLLDLQVLASICEPRG